MRINTNNRRRSLLLTSLLVLLVIITFLMRGLSAPVHGSQQKTGGPVPVKRAQKTAVLPQGTISNSYFTLALLAGYRIQNAGPLPSGLLYQQNIIKTANFGSVIIATSIKPLPEGGVSEDPAYRLRLQQSERYHIETRAIGGDQIWTVSDSEQSTIVAFWPHNSYLATISVSSSINDPGADQNASLQTILLAMLNGWQWQR